MWARCGSHSRTLSNNAMCFTMERVATHLAYGSSISDPVYLLAAGTRAVLGKRDGSGGHQHDLTEGRRRVTGSHSYTWMAGHHRTPHRNWQS